MESLPYLDFLKRGAKVWNEWRQQNPTTKPELIEADLESANLHEADLQGARLSR